MNEEQRVTEHEHNPLFGSPPIHFISLEERQQDAAAHKRNMAAASCEAAERDMALARAMIPPQRRRVDPPPLRDPELPADFAAHAAALNEKIFKRGVAVNCDRLVSLGKERFQELLGLDRAAREVQRVIGTRIDLTSWPSVEYAFQSANALSVTAVPRRTNTDIMAGAGRDRESAAR